MDFSGEKNDAALQKDSFSNTLNRLIILNIVAIHEAATHSPPAGVAR